MELRRRSLYQGGTYAVVTFVAWQVADLPVPAIGFPGWTSGFVIVLPLSGFPRGWPLAGPSR